MGEITAPRKIIGAPNRNNFFVVSWYRERSLSDLFLNNSELSPKNAWTIEFEMSETGNSSIE